MRDESLAAFSGYCAGAAFALAWNGKLGAFSEFFHHEEPKRSVRKYTTEDHIQMMRDRGEGGPPA